MSRRDLLDERELWAGLMKHPAWEKLSAYAEEQKAARLANILNGVDNLREEDKQRGEYLGIGLFLQYPRTIVEMINVQLDNSSEENDDGNE